MSFHRLAAAWRSEFMRESGAKRFDNRAFVAWLRQRPDHPGFHIAFPEPEGEDACAQPAAVKGSFRIAPQEEPRRHAARFVVK